MSEGLASMANFDGVAGIYKTLEYIAFGRALESARFEYLARLRHCRRVLIVGEGDGRFLERLVQVAPDATIRCVDSSAAMLVRAERRLDPSARVRVTFERADVRDLHVAPHAYDAIVTLFLLDCLSPGEVAQAVRTLGDGLQPDGLWLFADFSIPARGWQRLRAIAWVRFLYAFFRWRAGLRVRDLPPTERILADAGFRVRESRTFQRGLLKASLYSR